MQIANEQLYRTSSLHLASFLLSQGRKLLRIEPVDGEPARFAFVFERTAAVEALALAFLAGHPKQVDIHSFLEAQKRLKNLVHEQEFLPHV